MGVHCDTENTIEEFLGIDSLIDGRISSEMSRDVLERLQDQTNKSPNSSAITVGQFASNP